MVLRRRFRGSGYFRVAIAAGDAREEAVGDRGVLSQQFSGFGSGKEGQKAASREKSSAKREIAGGRAAQSENRTKRLSSLSFSRSLFLFLIFFFVYPCILYKRRV